ncbi:polysaccharide deacetylase family protein [Bifidobacterium sp. ESL0763]|uniref:polysaccharide deacetylase family protein n=1 Tax=Bifidobacterium sp. ESL0763 TaxID=2983227 RepID=UPI0023F9C11F|nr:polysaccharide deacetylase family protein [Bifidobacterium sp. ESL0763]MDF7664356.1 polysaccharide deacetylase family protein [Bifidobacterium sp. ESL0763]
MKRRGRIAVVVAALVVVAMVGCLAGVRPAYRYYRQAIAQCIQWGNSYMLDEQHLATLQQGDDALLAQAKSSNAVAQGRLDGKFYSRAEAASKAVRAERDIDTTAAKTLPQADCAAHQLPTTLRGTGQRFEALTRRSGEAVARLDAAFRPLELALFDGDPVRTAQQHDQLAALLPGIRCFDGESAGLLADEGLRHALDGAITRSEADLGDAHATYGRYVGDQDALYKAADAMVASRNRREGIDCGHQRCVALTFDDGPASTTPGIAKLLRTNHAHATFFAIGQKVGGNGSVIASSPHRLDMPVGSHTWSHEDLPKIMKNHDEPQQLDATAQAIQTTTGHVANEVRPPHGAVDEASRTYIGQHLGSSVVEYGVDAYDWANGATDSSVRHEVEAQVRPGDIVLMHDVYRHTLDDLPDILAHLHGQGYRFVTVPELTGEYPRAGTVYYGRDDILRM